MTFQPRTRRAVRCLSALTLAGVLGLSGAAPYITLQPVSAYADPQSELDAAKAKLAEIGAEYQALQTELQQAGAQLEETASQIADTQTQLDSAQALLSENVSSDYKKGSVSLIDILLSSQDFTDLISRVFYVSKVNDAQTNAIESVKELQVQLQQQQTEQQQALSDTQAKVDAQAENQARAAAVVDSLSAEVQAQIEAEAQEDENLAAGMQSAQDASNGASQVPVTGNQNTSNNSGSTSGNNNQGNGNQSSNNNQSTNNQGGNQNQNQPSGGGQNTTPTPAPEPEPEPEPPATGSGTATVSTPVGYALQMAGQPYVSGGESLAEGGFDCSGLVYYAYQKIGITLPRTSGGQYTYFRNNAGRFTTSVSQLQYGDVVFFPGHVAFYVGNGQVFGATRPGQVAGYGNIGWYGTFLGGGQL